MDFADESYVRLYTRDTLSWKRLGWEGQALFCLMLRKVDRAGILEGTGSPVEDVALFIEMPTDIVRVGLERLIKQEIVQVSGDNLIIPKFIEAQAVVRGPKERQRECRERKRDMARLGLDPQQRGAVIYFIQSELGGPIKIGRATDLAKRLVGLATGRPDTLTVLASFSGTVADERTLHSRLAPYRAKGEWFQDCPEVLAVVSYAAEHGATVMPWLVSRDLSQPVTPVVTKNKKVTLSEPSSSVPNSTEEQHRAPARVGANSEPEPPSSPTVTEIRRIGSEPYPSPAVVGSDVVKPESSSKLEPRSEFGGGTFPAEYIQYPKGWRWSAETESEALMQAVSRDDLQEHVNFWTTHKWSIPVTDLDGELRRNIPNIRTRRETNAAKAAAQRNRAPPAPAKPAKPAAEGMREWREREARLYEQEQQRRAEQRLKAQRCKT